VEDGLLGAGELLCKLAQIRVGLLGDRLPELSRAANSPYR